MSPLTKESLTKMTVKELKAFLRTRGSHVRLSGLKPELLERAQLYFDQPVAGSSSSSSSSPPRGPTSLDSPGLNWMDISRLVRKKIPSSFTTQQIDAYLTENYCLDEQDCDKEMVNCSVQKPAKKGFDMYMSNKVHMVEFAETNREICFRANMEASLDKKKFNFPTCSISENGKVQAARCTCKAQADSRLVFYMT